MTTTSSTYRRSLLSHEAGVTLRTDSSRRALWTKEPDRTDLALRSSYPCRAGVAPRTLRSAGPECSLRPGEARVAWRSGGAALSVLARVPGGAGVAGWPNHTRHAILPRLAAEPRPSGESNGTSRTLRASKSLIAWIAQESHSAGVSGRSLQSNIAGLALLAAESRAAGSSRVARGARRSSIPRWTQRTPRPGRSSEAGIAQRACWAPLPLAALRPRVPGRSQGAAWSLWPGDSVEPARSDGTLEALRAGRSAVTRLSDDTRVADGSRVAVGALGAAAALSADLTGRADVARDPGEPGPARVARDARRAACADTAHVPGETHRARLAGGAGVAGRAAEPRAAWGSDDAGEARQAGLADVAAWTGEASRSHWTRLARHSKVAVRSAKTLLARNTCTVHRRHATALIRPTINCLIKLSFPLHTSLHTTRRRSTSISYLVSLVGWSRV